ncbi:MAG: hypothetical protein PHP44_07395 [Kiritimatiellae bacterium]|nr:hypothetical protein [Kiritimatiellia bacterium]MDD4735913.1 hypothetical protein [Kiritimatiellia bacterium]
MMNPEKSSSFDFWYAVNNTEVLRHPATLLETFGNTMVNYHLLTEPMDDTDKVRIREGRIEAYKPQIITPSSFGETALEGFGEEAEHYAEWLRDHEADLMILKYGFSIKKQVINDHIVSENMPMVIDRLKTHLDKQDDPLSALVVGVEEPWEVCLLKLMVEVVQRSAPKHVTDLRNDPDGRRHEIERAFLEASRDAACIPELSQKLHDLGLFEQFEDRFFSLLRARR